MDSETEFICGLLKLQYGQKVEKGLKISARKVSWARGWPEDNKSFWNAEAFMWGSKIEKEKRKLIKKELEFLENKKNLDLGCGSYSYVKSIGLDISEKMLQFNDNLTSKIVGDVEKELPFKEKEFDSVTANFLLNYVKNYGQLLKEIHRVLVPKGHFVTVLSSTSVQTWHKQKEINNFPAEKWKKIIEEAGFKVKFYEKDKLWFFKGVKSNPPKAY